MRLALDLAEQQDHLNFIMDAQMNLVSVAMMKGTGDEAVALLSQHLPNWIENCGPHWCAGECFQVRGEDAPMLSCDRCSVVRCVNAATLCRAAASCMPAVGWLTGERGCMMQVLERSAPEVGMEGRH